MTKILVAEDEQDIRALVVDTLFDKGYNVLESRNGRETYQVACQEVPDLILLDVMMPVMDRFEVLAKLKDNPVTDSIPVIMLTAMWASEGEQNAMNLGVHHYISKPFDPETLQATIRVALREAQPKFDEDDGAAKVWGGSKSSVDGNGETQFIPLGFQLSTLEKKLEGGIRVGSLTLMEGASATGKSLLCNYVATGALAENLPVSYFTSQHTPRSLEAQAMSIGMSWTKAMQSKKLRVYPIQEPNAGEDSGPMLGTLAAEIERVQRSPGLIIVDAITNIANSAQEQAIISFFAFCKRLSNKGHTILLITHSSAFDSDLLARAASLCETHLNLRTGKIQDKVVRVVTVLKLDDVDLNNNNEISFGVEPGVGISVIPYSQAKA